MVNGVDVFKEWFKGYEEQYALIGGTACDILFEQQQEIFRGTKDFDMVLIIEALNAEFGKRFWDFIQAGGYEFKNRSTGKPHFYRFSHPSSMSFPFMIELFTRKPEALSLPCDAVLTPLPIEEDISSLSAILLNDEYYEFLKKGVRVVDGINILDTAYLIPFKMKAWLDLSARKARGEAIDSKNIKKHKNDVFRLYGLLTENTRIDVPFEIRMDIKTFITAITDEKLNLPDIGVKASKESVLESFTRIYVNQ